MARRHSRPVCVHFLIRDTATGQNLANRIGVFDPFARRHD